MRPRSRRGPKQNASSGCRQLSSGARNTISTTRSLAATYDAAPAAERTLHRKTLAAHHRPLQEWAENCPENFANRAALVLAEIARLEGRDPDAEQLYEQAIRSARDNGFVHNEALA